jgi:hypothetical protein
MTDKEYIDNLTIWCTYHKDYFIDDYNLNYIYNRKILIIFEFLILITILYL